MVKGKRFLETPCGGRPILVVRVMNPLAFSAWALNILGVDVPQIILLEFH